jgi:hypothetical protein
MPPCDVLSISCRALAGGAAQATAEASAATVDIESARVKMRINLLDADVEYKRTVIATLERTLKEKEAGPDRISVDVTCHPYLLENEGLFTQGSQPGRTVGESVGGILEMDSPDWSSGIRYHIINTRPETEHGELIDFIHHMVHRRSTRRRPQ